MESDYLIKKLNLNRVKETIFAKETIEQLPQFLNKYKYPYYNLRDKDKPSGKFLHKITTEEVINISKNYNKFSIYESLAIADEKLILQGDIQINNDFTMLASLNNINGISNRKAMQNPIYNINIDLKEKKEPYINGLTNIINYIISHQLFEIIVEFSIFNIPVGINRENIIIWELRNY